MVGSIEVSAPKGSHVQMGTYSEQVLLIICGHPNDPLVFPLGHLLGHHIKLVLLELVPMLTKSFPGLREGVVPYFPKVCLLIVNCCTFNRGGWHSIKLPYK